MKETEAAAAVMCTLGTFWQRMVLAEGRGAANLAMRRLAASFDRTEALYRHERRADMAEHVAKLSEIAWIFSEGSEEAAQGVIAAYGS